VNIFFDVDFTLITWNYRLRPHVREVFRRLREEGHTLYIWSGRGERWEVIEQFALHEFIAGCYSKPLYDHASRLEELGIPVQPDFVIDDHAEPVAAFGGAVIQPPHTPLEDDREMLRIYDVIQAHLAAGAVRHVPGGR
jgi:SAM-dependent methyltransferase